MSTWREMIFMVLDEIKMSSDDSIYTKDHIAFLLSKYRSYIINSTYYNQKKAIPESNYQSICVPIHIDEQDFCGNTVLVSSTPVPKLMSIGNTMVYPPAGFEYGNIIFVSPARFKYVGQNSYTKNFIYATIGPDSRLYVKSNNRNFIYLNTINITGLFESAEEAAEFECNEDDSDNCELLDKKFPLEDAYAISLIQLVTKDLLGTIYRPSDNTNNATDDISDISKFIRMNMKDRFSKNAQPDELQS